MKKLKIFFIILFIVIFIILSIIGYKYYKIKTAKIEVILNNNLTLEFNDKKKVSDFIISINGHIIDDYLIDSTVLGKKDIEFEFINNDNIKVKYKFKINVIDTTSPVVFLSNNYTIKQGDTTDLTERILCGDNYDSKPNCFIEGTYDINSIGSYPLTFNAIDSSGNKTTKDFTLNVIEPITNNSNNKEENYISFLDIKNKYKTENTSIGLDISSWQGDIDFQKIKDAGVEFVIIRVGGTKGTNKEYFLDSKFKRNIKEANKYNIPVGIYFYSYADSIEGAIKDAKWVINQIKDYKVELPIAFDWEEWAYFNSYNLSFFGLTSMANSFLDTISKAGYKGMLYSSKTYLENIWLDTKYDIWLAHYIEQTNYEEKYRFWQLCNNGKVDGINSPVDIDIMYK